MSDKRFTVRSLDRHTVPQVGSSHQPNQRSKTGSNQRYLANEPLASAPGSGLSGRPKARPEVVLSSSDQCHGERQPSFSSPAKPSQKANQPSLLCPPTQPVESEQPFLHRRQTQRLAAKQPLPGKSVVAAPQEKPQASSQLSLDSLPISAILRILSYLSVPDLVLRVRPTCWYLHDVSHDPSLWTLLDVSVAKNYHKRKDAFLAGLLEQQCYIAGRQAPAEHIEDEATVADPDHEEADKVSRVSTDDTKGKQTPTKRPNEQTPLGNKRVRDYVRKLTINNESLVAPIYFVCDTEHPQAVLLATDNGVHVDPEGRPFARLEKLVVNNPFYEPSIVSMIAKHPWLKHLSLTIFNKQASECIRVAEEDLSQSFHAFKNLRQLKTFSFIFPTSKSFTNSLANNTLFSNSRALHETMKDFFEVATDLEDIVVVDASDSVLQAIQKSCSNLKSLALCAHTLSRGAFDRRGMSRHTESLQSLSMNCTLSSVDLDFMMRIVGAFPNLKAVNFTGTQVTEEALSCLLTSCLKLEAVHLGKHRCDFPQRGSECTFSSASLSHLWSAGRAPLREFSCRADVDDIFVRRLCECNSTLTDVTLVHCPDLTDLSLVTLAELCPRLKRFQLSQKKSRVTARGVLNFIRKRPTLTSVDVLSMSGKRRFVATTPETTESAPLAIKRAERGPNGSKTIKAVRSRPANADVEGICDGKDGRTDDPDTVSAEGVLHEGTVGGNSSVEVRAGNADRAVRGGYQGQHGRDGGGGSELVEISIGKVPQVKSLDMLTLLRFCPDLVTLSLHGCLALSDYSVEIILRY